MRVRTLAALMAALLIAWPATAQEQRGTIEGVVRDASGAVLPGVTVEARAANGAVLTTTSDETGTYRFPSVAPGDYVVSATLDNFAPGKNDAVRVGLGQVKKVDFSLSPKGVTESVQVVAESPLVDVRQSARQTNIRAEQVELMPKGRDFTTLVTQAPGANRKASLAACRSTARAPARTASSSTASRPPTCRTAPRARALIADFVEEVQVKSSGYTAEFGGATGGVINVITKSGTNDWRGNALFNWQGDKLRGENRRRCGSNLTDADIRPNTSRIRRTRRTASSPASPSAVRSSRNRAWFFGAYQPAFTTNERRSIPTTAVNPDRRHASTRTRSRQVQYITGNVTGQFSDALRGRLAYNNSWSKTDGLLPALTGTDRLRHELRLHADVPELGRSRATSTGWRRRSCSSACAAATTSRTSTTPT